MLGHSMPDKDYVKLSHFDRLRRGYFDKVPMNFAILGFICAINLLELQNLNMQFAALFGMFALGNYLKGRLLEEDDIELKKYSKEIEAAYKARLKSQSDMSRSVK